jgi:hypothetical protein
MHAYSKSKESIPQSSTLWLLGRMRERWKINACARCAATIVPLSSLHGFHAEPDPATTLLKLLAKAAGICIVECVLKMD